MSDAAEADSAPPTGTEDRTSTQAQDAVKKEQQPVDSPAAPTEGDTEQKNEGKEEEAAPTDGLPPPGHTAPVPEGAEASGDNKQYPSNEYPMGGYGAGQRMAVDSSGQPLPLTINQLAIVASAQNKLPVSKVKGIVLRVGRHTESSAQKSGKWYKNEGYVDKNTYTWRNMPLFDDYQRHLWTPEGTVRHSWKK